jgi:outer membrane protein assembly factor BamB
MKTPVPILLAATVAALVCMAADWPTQSGNPQREGWARNEKAFTRENARSIELLYKYKADNPGKGASGLTAPIVNGMLITYLGFKEMLVFGGNHDNVYSVDADLNRIIWKTHFEYRGEKPAPAPTAVCPGGLTASPAMPGSSTALGRGPAPAPGRGVPPPATPGRGPVATPPAAPPAPGRAGLFATGFGRSGVFIAVSSDGMLHPLNTSTGADKVPAVRFVPAGSKVSGLNIFDNVVYAATEDGCGGAPNRLYALDFSTPDPVLSTFEARGAGPAGSGGTAIGTDGTIYAQFPEGTASGDPADSVIAFSKGLKPKDFFAPSDVPSGPAGPGITPMVFSWKGKDVVLAAGRNGRIYLLDSESPGGPDHHTPLAATEPAVSLSGAFSSQEDTEGTRWIYAPTLTGVKAFRVADRDGKPALDFAWNSREMAAPTPPIAANGLLFVLDRGKGKSHAVLYALDGSSGAELYSTGAMAAATSDADGFAIANRRIYFTTRDNTVYALGFMADQPQLTGK